MTTSGISSEAFTTSAASLNWGMSLGGTKEQTSISGIPQAASARTQAIFSSVGKNVETL